jgi:hypothetical protein
MFSIQLGSSVYVAGTEDRMLNGKEFNRAVRALTLTYEALSVSRLGAFFRWCFENNLKPPKRRI